MAHVHDPVIYHPDRHQIGNLLKTAPFAVAAALGWTVGMAWHTMILLATAIGVVLGTTFLAVKHLGFAVAYGFLKGAQIKLVPKNQGRNPSMPM
jgi:hypothetical protein